MPTSATTDASVSTSSGSLSELVEAAAACVAPAWPLHSFVTANPLAGFENQRFTDAVAAAEELFDAKGYPPPSVFRNAWQRGEIDHETLRAELASAGHTKPPRDLLNWLERQASAGDPMAAPKALDQRTDEPLVKWLTVFLDEGQAEWPMPHRERGFYAAWRSVAIHDGSIPGGQHIAEMPESATAAIDALIGDMRLADQHDILQHQFANLPGWVGRIKQRMASGSDWQNIAPITLIDYAAVRLTLLYVMGENFRASEHSPEPDDAQAHQVAECFLRAWEQSYRERLIHAIAGAAGDDQNAAADNIEAQWVFCIDTRSEVIRRHLETTGRHETFGFAGFFGLPIQYARDDAETTVPACPPILKPAHHISDDLATGCEKTGTRSRQWRGVLRDGWRLVNDLKHNVGAAFHFVEISGPLYGLAMAVRTLLPRKLRALGRWVHRYAPHADHYGTPDLDGNNSYGDASLPVGLTHEQKVQYAAGGFSLMGWSEFAPVVVFVGHGGESANNAFASSLHCGACAGHRGGPNARVLAAICNEPEVRAALNQKEFAIPEHTVFLAAEHNTTTDDMELFVGGTPLETTERLQRIRRDLTSAKQGAVNERGGALGVGTSTGALAETDRRASDWSEPRPEWGLAGNAAFVIGPRWLTQQLNLSGRCFLHSYDWQKDVDGSLLETICQGPMVVTQWINNHYYFATVDNAVFGSGSKVTQNPVGNIGVVQGNGGDLMTGLPLQSVADRDDRAFHQPLRLTVLIHAPAERVLKILQKHEPLRRLVANEWISVVSLDPQADLAAVDLRGRLCETKLVAI